MKLKFKNPGKEVLDKHYRELGITRDSLTRDVASLQAWMDKQPHLPHNVEAKILEKFLIHSKNSMERAKVKLDNYYNARSLNPDMYTRDPLDPDIRNIFETGRLYSLPEPTAQGDRIQVCKFVHDDGSRFDAHAVLKFGLMAIDCRMKEEACIRLRWIMDFGDCSLAAAAHFTLPMLKTAIKLYVGVFPQSIVGFHVVNIPSFCEPIVNLGKHLLGGKLAQRVIVHSDLESLHEHIPKDILPAEYGGTYPATVNELRDLAWQYLMEQREWILQQNSVKADESKRPNQMSIVTDMQMEGSFRKIEID